MTNMAGIKNAASLKPLFRSSSSKEKKGCRKISCSLTCTSDINQYASNVDVQQGLMSETHATDFTTMKAEQGSDLFNTMNEFPSVKIKRKSLERRAPGRRKKRKDSIKFCSVTEHPKKDVNTCDSVSSFDNDNSTRPSECCTTITGNFSIGNDTKTNEQKSWNFLNSPSPNVNIGGFHTDCVVSSTPVRLGRMNLNQPPEACSSTGKNCSNLICTSTEASACSMSIDNLSSVCLFDNSSFVKDDSSLAAFDLTGVVNSHEAVSQEVKNAVPPNFDVNKDLKKENKKTSLEELIGNESLQDRHSEPQPPVGESSFYGLPGKVKVLLEQHRGISTLYDWQRDCLNLPAVLEGKNLIYSLPTSGGKTLVAEILIMKELLIKKKDAMFILPFVSIVQEKVNALANFAVDLGFLVEEYAGSKGKIPPRKRRKKRSLYIATIEKANALVNSLIEESRISEVGLVVVDELHMLGEGGARGGTLETCLAKLLFSTEATQIIGMSATLSNLNDLRRFLRAEDFYSDFRPVDLCEYFKISNNIYEVKANKSGSVDEPIVVRNVEHRKENKQLLMRDPDHLVALVLEVIPKNSCLVFCPTKKNCQSLVEMLASFMPRELKEVKAVERQELLRALKNQASGVCPILYRVIVYGMAYHHSGLTMDERKLIEEAYKEGILCLLTCTSTLAAGVNLPAKRVILRAPYVADSIISRSLYKQMIGRAGRAGIDTSGESILVLKETDKTKIGHLFAGPFDNCLSSLRYEGGKGLRALILNVVGLKLCVSTDDVKSFINCTLLAVQCKEPFQLEEQISSALESLVELGHLRVKQVKLENEVEYKLEVTDLGVATFKGCVDINSSPVIFEELKKAQQNLVLSTELHLLYLVTPLDMSNSEPNWMVFFQQFTHLNEEDQQAAEVIGVNEGYLCRRAKGQRCSKEKINEAVARRFYHTLMLYKLMKEHTVWNVADTFQITRGFAQNLLTSASSFASCMVRFTAELKEFWAVKLLLEAMVKKLSYTASIELIPLLEISGVKQARARQFFRAGYKTLQQVARANVEELIKEIEHLPRKQARQIVSAATMLLEEKADALREEAEEMVS